MKSSKVSIKTRSTPASLSFKGQATKHTTVKWSIVNFTITFGIKYRQKGTTSVLLAQPPTEPNISSQFMTSSAEGIGNQHKRNVSLLLVRLDSERKSYPWV